MDPRGMIGRIYKEDHYPVHCFTQNMKALGLVVSEKIFFMFLPLQVYESYLLPWKPVLIRPGPKPNATFPHPNDDSDKI